MNFSSRSRSVWRISTSRLAGNKFSFAYSPVVCNHLQVRLLSKKKDSKTDNTGQKVTVESVQAKPSSPLYDASLLDELVTIQDVYRYAVTQYNKNDLSFGHSTTNAFEDASFLIMHELYLPFEDPIKHWSESRLSRPERQHLLDLIHTRITTKKPTPYLVKGCYQQGMYFYVDERVLIPRSYLGEIMLSKTLNIVGSNGELMREYQQAEAAKIASMPSALFKDCDYEDYFGSLVEPAQSDVDFLTSNTHDDPSLTMDPPTPTTITTNQSPPSPAAAPSVASLLRKSPPPPLYLIDTDKIFSVLDLCTGSGCLAILAAKAFPLADEIDAVDISHDALEVAYANVQQHQLGDFITLHKGDLYDPLQGDEVADGSYDLIISNPPYVDEEGMSALPEEYRHEPILALHAQDRGIDIIRSILLRAHDHLNEGGGLLCEVGQCREQLMEEFPLLFGEEVEEEGGLASASDADAAAAAAGEEQHEVRYRHNEAEDARQTKVHWLTTENASNEVFYVQKKYLTKKYLKKL